jgi:MraZ protein
VAVHGPDGCLSLFPQDHYEILEYTLQEESYLNPVVRYAVREICGSAEPLQMDPQNRITLTAEQLTHAGIKTQCLLVGALNTLELWSPEKYEEYRRAAGRPSHEQALELIAEASRRAAIQVRSQREQETSENKSGQ